MSLVTVSALLGSAVLLSAQELPPLGEPAPASTGIALGTSGAAGSVAGGRGAGATSYGQALSAFNAMSGLTAKPGGDRGSVLAVFSDAKAKNAAELQEDLRVMGHILEKTVEERAGTAPRSRVVLGIPLLQGFGSEAVTGLYLEGYGALFLLDVNLPLLAPAGKESEKSEAQAAKDSEWETARRELFGQPETALVSEPVEAYSEEKVARLKTAILDALRNAANIRGLGPHDAITVCVTGSAPMRPMGSSARPDPFGAIWPEKGARTVMTIKVKKSDADEFNKGVLSKEDFAKRAQVAVYSTPPGSPSWMDRFGGGLGGGHNMRGGSTGGDSGRRRF